MLSASLGEARRLPLSEMHDRIASVTSQEKLVDSNEVLGRIPPRLDERRVLRVSGRVREDDLRLHCTHSRWQTSDC